MAQNEDFQAALDRIGCSLAAVTSSLAWLIESSELAVQRNSVAALSACLESSNTCLDPCLELAVPERAVALLGSSTDPSLQLNLLVLLGMLGEADQRTSDAVLAAGGAQQLLLRADPTASTQLQEAAVDGLCKLAANNAASRDTLVAAGAIPRLAALLSSSPEGRAAGPGGDASAEVRVRALLCLGMLVADSPQRQLELAGAPGAVAALLRLTRQHDDGDVQQIAASLFKELARNAEAKDAITAALKQQQAAHANNVPA